MKEWKPDAKGIYQAYALCVVFLLVWSIFGDHSIRDIVVYVCVFILMSAMFVAMARGTSLAIEDSVLVQRDLGYRREVQIARITEISGSKSGEYGRTIVKEIGRKIEISNAAYGIGAVNEIVAELLKRNSGIQFS